MVAIEHRQTSAATTNISILSNNNIGNTNNNNQNNNQLAAEVLSPTASASSTNSSASFSSPTTTTSTTNSNHPEQHSKTKKNLSPASPELPINKNIFKIEKKMSSPKEEDKLAVQPQQPQQQQPAANEENGKQNATTKSAVSQRNVDLKIEKKSSNNSDNGTQQLTKKVLKLDLSGKELNDHSIKSPKSPITGRLPHQVSLTSSVDVEDRKTLREALYQGIFHRHRKTIFAMGSFLRMLRSRNSSYNTIRSSSEGEDIDEVR